MVRVKVFRLKEVLLKFIFGTITSIALYLVFSLCLKYVNANSRTFAASVVEENINYDTLYAKGDLNIQLLKRELGIDKKITKSKVSKEEPIPIYTLDNEISNTPIDYNIDSQDKYLEKNKVEKSGRANSYAVNQISSSKVQVGNACLINYSNLKLNLNELSKVSNFKINDKTNILIVHTHTSEAYSEVGTSTNFRTTDDSKNIVSVGNVLEKNMFFKNFNVMHSIAKHDTPSYNGAYKACLETIESEFKKQKYDIVLDVHRDALSSNYNFRPTVEINGENAAKLMFVVGTNASGLSHDNWMENLKLALLIQNTANEMYPGLFRDLNLSKSRYNQHVCDGALIIEVGATGNTLDEVWNSMKYFSNVIEALKD